MMKDSTVPFGEWLPDLPEHDNPGALIARNVIPEIYSYRQFNDLTSFSNALSQACLGTFWAQDDNNVVFNFCGDSDSLYELVAGATWTDRSGPSAPYAVDNWEFTKFGQRVIAAGFQSDLQYWDLGSSAAFADLPGGPPRARRIATVRDFVMLGDTDVSGGGGGANVGPNFIQWSAYNNSELWTPSIATQSDFQELPGRGGRVQRITPGEIAIIFTEQSIWRADYAGPPVIFQLDELEKKRGTPAPNSVVWSGRYVWYFGWDDFYMFDQRSSSSQGIGNNKIARWFAQNAASDAFETMRGALDRRNRLVMWAFKSSSSSPFNDRVLVYNWSSERWSYAEIETQLIDEYVSPGFTLDALDAVLPNGIDIDSIPVDSDQFTGGNLGVQAFDSSNRAATFSGAPLTAILDTKEIASPDNERSLINAVRPLVEGSGVTDIAVQVGTRNKLTDNTVFQPSKTLNGINGEASVRVNSRYARIRLNIQGGFDNAVGVKLRRRKTSGRR